jgi:hypothetical protein
LADQVEYKLLPTPRATRGGSGTETMYCLGGERDDANRTQGEVLLPTPRASDGTKGGPNQRGSSGDLMLPSAAAQLLSGRLTSSGSSLAPSGTTSGLCGGTSESSAGQFLPLWDQDGTGNPG